MSSGIGPVRLLNPARKLCSLEQPPTTPPGNSPANSLKEKSKNKRGETPVPFSVQNVEMGRVPEKLLLLTLKLVREPEVTEGRTSEEGIDPSNRLLDRSMVW
ncbi:hypothetical protein PanWU01x14_172500, partial [Parasponia andersonii]